MRVPGRVWAAVALSLALRTAAAAPAAACEAPAHDFGARLDDEVVRHAFWVANRGNAPLVLRAGRACCGLRVDVPPHAVAPGTAVEIRVDLALRGRSGRVVKAVFLQTNDPAQPVLRLELNGRVIALPGPPGI